jgi:hypothetical protein
MLGTPYNESYMLYSFKMFLLSCVFVFLFVDDNIKELIGITFVVLTIYAVCGQRKANP